MKFGSSASLIFVASLLFLCACGGSKKGSKEKGFIVGKVEQIFHHGAFNPDGPNRTVSPLEGVRLILSDTTGRSIDTIVSAKDGTFSAELEEGDYILTPSRQTEETNEAVPGSIPSPKRFTLHAEESVSFLFQYTIFAP